MTQELLEARRTEALIIIEEIRDSLETGWVSPRSEGRISSACADMRVICGALRNAYSDIEIMASYAEFRRTQDMIKEAQE